MKNKSQQRAEDANIVTLQSTSMMQVLESLRSTSPSTKRKKTTLMSAKKSFMFGTEKLI